MPFAVVGGIAAAGAGIYSAVQTGNAAGAAANTSQQAQQQSATLFGEQQGFESQLASLMANPSSITSLPGYQFNLQQGQQALTRQMSAGGYLGSGNMGAALEQYGQNYASNYFGTYESMLAQLSGITSNASAPLQTAVQGYGTSANAYGSLFNQAGQLGGGFGSLYSGGGGLFNSGSGALSGGVSDTAGGSSPYSIQTVNPSSFGYTGYTGP